MESRRFLVLDTTYALPLFGIDVEELASSKSGENPLERLWSRGIPGFDLVLPTTCLLEILFKLNREYKKQQDASILARYEIGFPTVKESKVVRLLDPLTSPACVAMVSKVRLAGHEDLLDCLIASCAISKKGVLLTEDDDLVRLLVENQFMSKDACIKWTSIKPRLNDERPARS
nr:PIN domain-containing protein [Candidatus Sigynarchaeum springense]MDO8117855.1 PIN domain-containing protein [Candidatus Sigynarchaeota archaeon]